MGKKIHNITNKNRTGPKNGIGARRRADVAAVYSVRNSLPLYRFVYSSAISMAVVFVLLTSFLIQGVQQVYAADDVVVNDVESTEVAKVEFVPDQIAELEDVVLEESSSESLPEDPVSFDGELNVDDLLLLDYESVDEVSQLDDQTVTAVVEDTPVSVEQLPTEPNNGNESDNMDTTDDTQEAQEVIEDISTVDSNTDETAATTDEGDVSVIESSEDILSEEEIASTTNYEIVSITESDSMFTFNKDECTRLATGSFYCLEPQENVLDDALFSAPDEDGDTEIFLVRDGEQMQITDNQVDDAAPYYDQNSNTIVWHRLIDDRFQIVSFDIESGLEEQVTKTAENNMEPTRQGNYTVWQRWTGAGWNIILHDGEREEQITNTASHNVAPHIHGKLVVWNRHSQSGEKTIEMYDIESNTYVTVNDPDGLSVANPRMVFVYDSLHPNGDIVTKGFDIISGMFIELDTLPRELPDELPNTDSTGETRALIQSKPSVKSDEVTHSSSTPISGPTPTPTITSATSSIEAMTLDLTVVIQASTTSMDVVNESLAEFDMIIPPLETIGTSSTSTVQE